MNIRQKENALLILSLSMTLHVCAMCGHKIFMTGHYPLDNSNVYDKGINERP